MSVKIKRRNENEYLYFQKKDGRVIFLGKVGTVSRYTDRVREAVDALIGKDSGYFEYEKKLISILPASLQNHYVLQIIKKMEMERNDLLSLSSGTKKYKPKGKTGDAGK